MCVSGEKCAEIALDSADNVAQMVIQKAQLISKLSALDIPCK